MQTLMLSRPRSAPRSPLSFVFSVLLSNVIRPDLPSVLSENCSTCANWCCQSSMAPASFPGIQYDNSGRPWFRGPGGEWIGSSHFVCCSRLAALISLTPTSSPTYNRLTDATSLLLAAGFLERHRAIGSVSKQCCTNACVG
jgi:hypothetical protein